jgi:metalloendopeptidase OMA1, mitochondrial
VFVFSGLLPICQDDDGIATVLGHEISHNLCHHVAESVSSSFLRWITLGTVLVLFGQLDISTLWLTDLAFLKPRSRRQETEADQVGLQLMALSCYDPRQALPFWERMQRAQQIRVPEFVSTHPSGQRRIKQLEEWMPSAIAKYEGADCSYTGRLCMNSFHKAFQSVLTGIDSLNL